MVITQGCDLSKLKILCALEQNPSVSWVNRLQTLSKHNSEPVICEGDLMNIWEPGYMVVCLFVFAVKIRVSPGPYLNVYLSVSLCGEIIFAYIFFFKEVSMLFLKPVYK